MDSSSLTLVRDNFFAGYYERCLDLAETLAASIPPIEKPELISLSLRARAALKQIKSQTPGPTHTDPSTVATIEALDFWNADNEDTRKFHLDELLKKAKVQGAIPTFLASAALCVEGSGYSPTTALKLSSQGPTEMLLLRVAQLILIDRPDLAVNVANSLVSQNDDAVLTKLASVLSNMSTFRLTGGCGNVWLGCSIPLIGNYQEAYLTCRDVQVQCCEGEEPENQASPLLLNQKAVANMHMRHWDEAFEDLLRAYQYDPKNTDTLANLVTCCYWLHREDDVKMYHQELTDLSPQHPHVVDMARMSDAFARFQQAAASS